MVNILNNVNLDKLSHTVSKGKEDKNTLKKPVKLQGEWNFNPEQGYQFRTELNYEKGKEVIEIDSPSFLGGEGNRLGPMSYCIAGITSCFIGTFVGIAAQKGIKLTKLVVNTECDINFAKTFDIANEPITEGIDIQVDVQSDNADRNKLQELLDMAKERCPAMYSMSNNIKVDAAII
jgi:uncharacterized OsmC-like protein